MRAHQRFGVWAGLALFLGVAWIASAPGHAGTRSAGTRDMPRLRAEVIRVQPLDGESGGGGLDPWFERGPTGRHAIASISKITAIMAVLDRDLDMAGTTEMVPSDRRYTRGGSRSRLRIGFKYRNRDLFTAALMSSDNRAVIALGRAVGLPRAKLTAAMNAKARSLGLVDTRFEEPTGISYGNVSTPAEILKTLRAALEYAPIRRVMTTPEAFITPAGKKRPREHYVNTDRLVRWGVDGILGGKTGYNREAGHSLTFAMRVGGRRVGVVILGAPTRNALFSDAKRLTRWIRREAKRR